VVGHHPHVVQGYDLVTVRGVQRLALYSLGNFISGMTWMLSPDQLKGMIAETGESYMAAVDVRCDPAGCRGPAARAGSHRELHERGVTDGGARMADLADGVVPLSPAWQAYWEQRLVLMRAFLSRFAPSTGSAQSSSAR